MNRRFLLYQSVARWINGEATRGESNPVSPVQYWFHAASAGEVEGLLPLIHVLQRTGKTGHLSVFSSSAVASIRKVRDQWAGQRLSGWSVGTSPREGGWEVALRTAAPARLVTYRYEAWPELWAAASLLKIPITIVGALDRPSLRLAKRALRLFGIAEPVLTLAAFDSARIPALSACFPQAKVEEIPNPRWERAASRVFGTPTARAVEVLSRLQSVEGPRLFLSQVWRSDLGILDLNQIPKGAAVVVVPHSMVTSELDAWERNLAGAGFRVERSRPLGQDLELVPDQKDGNRVAWLINEIGILPELYRLATAVYVGGGFEKGIHSTIEPALLGLPLSCGPRAIEKFEEVGALQRVGQLVVLRSPDEWKQWVIAAVRQGPRSSWSDHWKREVLNPLLHMDWSSLLGPL